MTDDRYRLPLIAEKAPSGWVGRRPGALRGLLAAFVLLLRRLLFFDSRRLRAKLHPVGHNVEVALVVDQHAALDQDLAAFGNILGHRLALLAEDDHGEVGGLVLAVADADINDGECLLSTPGLLRPGVTGRVADDDQNLLIDSGSPLLKLTPTRCFCVAPVVWGRAALSPTHRRQPISPGSPHWPSSPRSTGPARSLSQTAHDRPPTHQARNCPIHRYGRQRWTHTQRRSVSPARTRSRTRFLPHKD